MFMEDSVQVYPTMHTFFINADNLFRPDENIERVEIIRGGSSSLFGSNTPGAIINFINKTGGPELSGTLKATAGTHKDLQGLISMLMVPSVINGDSTSADFIDMTEG